MSAGAFSVFRSNDPNARSLSREQRVPRGNAATLVQTQPSLTASGMGTTRAADLARHLVFGLRAARPSASLRQLTNLVFRKRLSRLSPNINTFAFELAACNLQVLPRDAADPDSLACLGASEIDAVSTETRSGNPDEARSAIRSLLEALRSL